MSTSVVTQMVGKPRWGQTVMAHIHAVISRGIPLSRVSRLARMLGLAPEEMASWCAIPRSTFRRSIKKSGYRMPLMSSDLLVRYAALLDQAIEALDDADSAKQWLRLPQIGLGGAIPLAMAATTPGFREVEKLLTRINHGVYA